MTLRDPVPRLMFQFNGMAEVDGTSERVAGEGRSGRVAGGWHSWVTGRTRMTLVEQDVRKLPARDLRRTPGSRRPVHALCSFPSDKDLADRRSVDSTHLWPWVVE